MTERWPYGDIWYNEWLRKKLASWTYEKILESIIEDYAYAHTVSDNKEICDMTVHFSSSLPIGNAEQNLVAVQFISEKNLHRVIRKEGKKDGEVDVYPPDFVSFILFIKDLEKDALIAVYLLLVRGMYECSSEFAGEHTFAKFEGDLIHDGFIDYIGA